MSAVMDYATDRCVSFQLYASFEASLSDIVRSRPDGRFYREDRIERKTHDVGASACSRAGNDMRKGKQRNLREGRRSIAGVFYSITFSTLNREPILAREDVFEAVLSSLRFREGLGSIRVCCLLVMPDHLHMIVRLGSVESLSEFVKSMKTQTARMINDLLERTGSLWQKGYYDRAVREESALNAMVRHIRENPVRAGLTLTADEYPHWWSEWT
jgi:putative transposase